MKFRHLILLTMLVPAMVAADDITATIDEIGQVIDDFHDAAAHGDKSRYLGHLTPHAVFMGTDEWERWPKHPDFSDYVDSRFKDGAGWNYRSVERTIAIADSPDVAWFDEVLFSESNGRFRGTGVMMRNDEKWRIAHYAMSFLIFNENWDEVIELSRKIRSLKEDSTADGTK